MKYFALVVPTVILVSFVFALVRKVKVYDSFTDGVKKAFPLVLSVFPYIAAVLMLVRLLEASGLDAWLVRFLAPAFRAFAIPEEIAELILVRPLSGSGGTALLSEIINRYGVDSYPARCACVVSGASETVFYIGAVYFAGLKRKKLPVALLISLLSYFASVVLCCLLCKVL